VEADEEDEDDKSEEWRERGRVGFGGEVERENMEMEVREGKVTALAASFLASTCLREDL
jgi:hypothetical protein